MKKQIKTLIFITTLVGGGVAHAATDSVFYGGVSVGSTEFGDDGGDDTSFGLRVGSSILPYIDLEGGYNKLGTADGGVEINAKYITVKPKYSYGMLDLYARAGFNFWDADINGVSDDSVDFMYGVGIDYFINGNLSVGVSYTHYDLDGDYIKDSDAAGYEVNVTYYY